MTQDEMRRALNLGSEWEVIWTGASPLDTFEHVCGGLYGPGRAYGSRRAPLTYAPTGRPGTEAAWCKRCWVACVRRAER